MHMKKTRIANLLLRYKLEIRNMALIGVLITFLFAIIYPGEESAAAIFDVFSESALAGLFRISDVESPGWILWVSLLISIVLYVFLSIAGINLGAKIIPTIEKDSLEMIFSNSSNSARSLYVKNFLGAVVSLFVMTLPIFTVIALFSLIYPSMSLLGELSVFFFVSLIYGFFFMVLTSAASLLFFSKSFGKTIAYSYFIFGFLIDVLAGSPEYAEFADLSLNHYLNPTSLLFTGFTSDTFQEIWVPFLVILGVCTLLFGIGLWRVKFSDQIERSNPLQGKSPRLGVHPFFPFLSPGSRIGKKYPLFINQLRKDVSLIFILICVIGLHQFALFRALPSPDELLVQLNQSNTPIFQAFAQNHVLPESLLGFLILKFYSAFWLYFGIVIALLAARIPNHDVRHSTHDLILANNISPWQLIGSRMLSLGISFSLLIWGVFGVVRAIQASVQFEFDLILQAQIFTVLWLHYLGMAIFLIGIAMLPVVSKGKNLAVLVFIFFILMGLIPFLNTSIEFLKYLSFIAYYDPVGMIVGEVSFGTAFLQSALLFCGASLFMVLILRTKFAKTDFR